MVLVGLLFIPRKRIFDSSHIITLGSIIKKKNIVTMGIMDWGMLIEHFLLANYLQYKVNNNLHSNEFLFLILMNIQLYFCWDF